MPYDPPGQSWYGWESIVASFSRQRGRVTIEAVTRFFHHRWSVPTVWVLYSEGPHTFAALHRRLGASRDTLADTLANLAANGIVVKPGAPRQPYTLTRAGAVVGIACGACVDLVVRTGTRDIALKKWPFLVLTAMGRGASRYNQLLASLPGITPRALAQALRDLEAEGLVSREVLPWRPPVTTYSPTEKGNAMLPELDALARACDDAMAVIER